MLTKKPELMNHIESLWMLKETSSEAQPACPSVLKSAGRLNRHWLIQEACPPPLIFLNNFCKFQCKRVFVFVFPKCGALHALTDFIQVRQVLYQGSGLYSQLGGKGLGHGSCISPAGNRTKPCPRQALLVRQHLAAKIHRSDTVWRAQTVRHVWYTDISWEVEDQRVREKDRKVKSWGRRADVAKG